MMDPKDFIHLLVEIRDIQREHLEEYRRVTQEQLELSRKAVKRQEHALTQEPDRLGRWRCVLHHVQTGRRWSCG
jgi:hypothetical protein